MDNRFKPIGGMFQGVRGSTDIGGSPKSAAKLVKLNQDGVVDNSCLPGGVRKAASVAEDLEKETADRIEGDLDLGTRLDSHESTSYGKFTDIYGKISDLSIGLSRLDERQASDTSRIDGEITSLKESVSSIKTASDRYAESISGLESDMETAKSDILSSSMDIQSLNSRVDADDDIISKIQMDMVSMSADTRQLASEVASWSNSLITLSNKVNAIETNFDAFRSDTLDRFESMQSEIDELRVMVKQIYDRLFPGN